MKIHSAIFFIVPIFKKKFRAIIPP
jgi:hypothetical protein